MKKYLLIITCIILVCSVPHFLCPGISIIDKGLQRTGPWYPFPFTLNPKVYSAGPLAMTSNIREDNPSWSELPALNQMIARLSYAMTRGEPLAQIAWLHPRRDWPDKVSIKFFDFTPEKNSLVSNVLMAGGLTYDWVSRKNLKEAVAGDSGFTIGKAHYAALLITDLESAEPELLKKAEELISRGVPVVILGGLPARAQGWADHQRRDEEVKSIAARLKKKALMVLESNEIAGVLRSSGIRPALEPASPGYMTLRLNLRKIREGYLLLLFNETGDSLNQLFTVNLPGSSIDYLNPEDRNINTISENQHRIAVDVPAYSTRLLLIHDADKNNEEKSRDHDWDRARWQNPLKEDFPCIRWWLPGGAVEDDELRREIRCFEKAGFGSIEVQTLTIGFSFDELKKKENQIFSVGTEDYFNHLRTIFEESERLGIRVDMTLGSGWSSGGPFITENPEQQLICSFMDVEGPMNFTGNIPGPREPRNTKYNNCIIKNTISGFDEHATREGLVAARINTGEEPCELADFIDLVPFVKNNRLVWRVPRGKYRIFALYRNNTLHNAVGSAYPGARERSPILDHLSRNGIDEYIEKLGEPWLRALKPYKPRAFFIDSFELIGELPWSKEFRTIFLDLHGYDILPYVPLLFRNAGESKYLGMLLSDEPTYQSGEKAVRIREDYELAREELFKKSFILPLKKWTRSKGIKLRLQAHGGYGDYLDCYSIADIPESEGLYGGGSNDFLKLASSAGHVAGRNEISSESFINISLDKNAMDLKDYHVLIGNAFSAGINRIVYHGYAYRYAMH